MSPRPGLLEGQKKMCLARQKLSACSYFVCVCVVFSSLWFWEKHSEVRIKIWMAAIAVNAERCKVVLAASSVLAPHRTVVYALALVCL